jgi:hypothetical protein
MGMDNIKRTGDIWLLSSHSGDDKNKSAVQQINLRIPLKNTEGEAQSIDFPPISDVGEQQAEIPLNATSSSGMPVYYFVREGPAEIKNGKLVFTKIPPRSKYPVQVTVVAWQYGRSIEPKIQSAEPVKRQFWIKHSLK